LTLHPEIHLQNEICADPAAAGCLYDAGHNARCDLAGPDTAFLPFNQGNAAGAGNPRSCPNRR